MIGSRITRRTTSAEPGLRFMNKPVLFLFSLANVVLGVFYGVSDGPYVDIGDGRAMLGSELLSSGGDDGLIITLALLTFLVTVAISLPKWMSSRMAGITYTTNYLVYAFFIFLAQLDTPLVGSIRLGDWPLLLCLVVPVIPFLLSGASVLKFPDSVERT